MRTVSETGGTAVMVATRKISGGFLGLNSTLTVHGDGTLRLSDRRFNTNETRKVSRSRVRSLQAALSKPEWQEVEPFYGQPVFDGFTETIEGGGEAHGHSLSLGRTSDDTADPRRSFGASAQPMAGGRSFNDG